MLKNTANESTPQRPLRLWPGVIIVVVQWLVRFVAPMAVPEAMFYGVMGGLLGAVAVAVWWVFFSRAPWSERLGAVAVSIVALFAASRLAHESIATGAQGMLFPILAAPVLSLALVAWAVASRGFSVTARRASMIATIFLACTTLALIRTGGFTSNFENDLHWRWSKTHEQRLLAQAGEETPLLSSPASTATLEKQLPEQAKEELLLPSTPVKLNTPEKRTADPNASEPTAHSSTPAATEPEPNWPGFRGSNRDGIIRGVQIETDWSASPPVELWRRPIGPGWSSFAVRGDRFYTQEQRGEEELVVCYSLITGEPIWRHSDSARFWESNGGAGPRGTPTLSNGRVFTFGATGILNVLDADDGTVVWSRNAAAEAESELPTWGFASSPLVVGDLVVVAASGRLVAYDLATGNPRWLGPAGGTSYSSPHLIRIDGLTQILLLREAGLVSVTPADGTLLWEHAWKGYPIVQPALAEDGDLLISVSDQSGLRRLAVTQGPGGWNLEERWTTIRLKPYFNDFVVHKGNAFGFDGSILACIDLKDGQRMWKGGRYGQGQLVLLADQDLLLVLSEHGELALVAAASEQFKELARLPAIKGKTWNHPVVIDNLLLVRNGQEMVAYRLARVGV